MYFVSSVWVFLLIAFRNAFKQQNISTFAYLIWRILIISFMFSWLFFTLDISHLIIYSSYIVLDLGVYWTKQWVQFGYIIVAGLIGIVGVIGYIRTVIHSKRCEAIQVTQCWKQKSIQQSFETFTSNHPHTGICFDAQGSSPYTFGVIRPMLHLTPACMEEGCFLEGILDHEAVHIRRKDCLWNILGYVCICLNWFNPVVWLLYYQLRMDAEISADCNAVTGRDEIYLEHYIENMRQEIIAHMDNAKAGLFSSHYANNMLVIRERALALKLGSGTHMVTVKVLMAIVCFVGVLTCHVHLNTGLKVIRLSVPLEDGERILNVEDYGTGADGAQIDVITTIIEE